MAKKDKKDKGKEKGSAKNVYCYMDVSISAQPAGRLVFRLFTDQVPKTSENFRCLCTGEKKGLISKMKLHYKNCQFHRVIRGFAAQGGDFEKGDGTGGESIYGKVFEDENFGVKHGQPGLLSMANRGPNTNGSQFFITLGKAPHLDGKHVVFGEIVKGAEVLDKMEAVKVEENTYRPLQVIKIEDCGVLDSVDMKKKKKKKRSSSSESSSSSSSSSSDKKKKKKNKKSKKDAKGKPKKETKKTEKPEKSEKTKRSLPEEEVRKTAEESEQKKNDNAEERQKEQTDKAPDSPKENGEEVPKATVEPEEEVDFGDVEEEANEGKLEEKAKEQKEARREPEAKKTKRDTSPSGTHTWKGRGRNLFRGDLVPREIELRKKQREDEQKALAERRRREEEERYRRQRWEDERRDRERYERERDRRRYDRDRDRERERERYRDRDRDRRYDRDSRYDRGPPRDRREPRRPAGEVKPTETKSEDAAPPSTDVPEVPVVRGGPPVELEGVQAEAPPPQEGAPAEETKRPDDDWV